MSLLEIKNLTMRFGGVTAVTGLDLQVEEGEIFSIIGPNGAGKTTVFNAVTGIYDPSEGTIAVAGRNTMRAFSWKVVLAALIVGMLTAVVAVVISVNIDLLWRASIKRQGNHANRHFSYAVAADSAWSYLRGDLAVEPLRNGRWAVVSADGKTSLAIAKTEEEANALRTQFENTLTDGRIDGAKHAQLERIVSQRTAQTRNIGIALVLGLGLGFLGTFAVWQRSRRTPETVAQAGVARTFQNIRLFRSMSVLENVLAGLPRGEVQSKGEELLAFVGLLERAHDLACDLPYGNQRRLEIARALATQPRLLLLDEPAAGMNPTESAELMDLIRRIRQKGITVLLIEHHMNIVMEISDRIAVLDYGCKIAEGTPAEVRANPRVIEAYLGKEEVV